MRPAANNPLCMPVLSALNACFLNPAALPRDCLAEPLALVFTPSVAAIRDDALWALDGLATTPPHATAWQPWLRSAPRGAAAWRCAAAAWLQMCWRQRVGWLEGLAWLAVHAAAGWRGLLAR